MPTSGRAAQPHAPRLDAARIGRRDLDEVQRSAVLEQQGDIAFQRRLIAFDREVVMGLFANDIRRQGALRQQGIGRDVLAPDVATRWQSKSRNSERSDARQHPACGRESTDGLLPL